MQPPKSKASAPDWAHELRDVLTAKTREPKGEGWMTADQFVTALNIGKGTALRYLRQGIASGHLEKFCGTADFQGRIRIQTWYRPVMKKK